MLTKEIILEEIESGIKDFCKVAEFNFECLGDSYFFVYAEDSEFEFIIVLFKEEEKFYLNSLAILSEANTINDEITMRTIERNKEIQEIIRELNLYLNIEENSLNLSYSSAIPEDETIIKAHTIMHLTSLKFLVVQIIQVIQKTIDTENQIRAN